MPIILSELALDGVLNYLQANLDAKVTSIAGDYVQHPLTLDAIASWHIREQPPGTDVTPSISVVVQTTDDERGDGYGALDNPSAYASQNPLVVQITDAHQDADTLTRRLMRYARAVWLCIRDMQQTAAMSPHTVTYNGTIIYNAEMWTSSDRSHHWLDMRVPVMVRLREEV